MEINEPLRITTETFTPSGQRHKPVNLFNDEWVQELCDNEERPYASSQEKSDYVSQARQFGATCCEESNLEDSSTSCGLPLLKHLSRITHARHHHFSNYRQLALYIEAADGPHEYEWIYADKAAAIKKELEDFLFLVDGLATLVFAKVFRVGILSKPLFSHFMKVDFTEKGIFFTLIPVEQVPENATVACLVDTEKSHYQLCPGERDDEEYPK